MSWSLGHIADGPAAEVKAKVNAEGEHLPQSIKDYISAGIDGLASWHGDDVVVNVSHSYGHLCTGKDTNSYEVTSATVMVQKATT